MAITTGTPTVGELDAVLETLRGWQSDDAPLQLHPGDVGWHWRTGEEATAAALRTWSADGRIVAIGMLDGPDLIRLTLAPDAYDDDELAQQLASDLESPDRGILPAGDAYVEAPSGLRIRDVLVDAGWHLGDAWSPLALDLAGPIDDPGIQFEVVGPERAHVRVALQRAAFTTSSFTVEAWHTMAAGPAYSDARCVVGYSDAGDPVAAITVWSAGPGRPGLIEPMGVDPDHRGHGYGTAITVAGARVLRQLGASSMLVCTESSNVGGVATYRAAGMTALPERMDLVRGA